MTDTKKGLWLVSMILIYIAIAIGGFLVAYIIKTYFLPPSQPATAPKVSEVKPVKIPAGWKIYTNADTQLKFAYPTQDKVKTSSLGFGVSSFSLQDTKGNVDVQILLFPKSLAQAIGQDFDEYYAMPDNTSRVIKNPLSKDSTTEMFTKIRNRTVNGMQAVDYKSLASNAPKKSLPEIGTIIASDNNLVLFSTDSENKTKLEEILSSFSYQQ